MNVFIDKAAVGKLTDEWVARVQTGTFYAVIAKKLGSATIDSVTREAKSRFGDNTVVESTKPGWVRVVYERKLLYIHLEPEEIWRVLGVPGVCLYSKRREFWIGVKE